MADMHAIARLAALAHSELADHALLARFATERDEFAFAALVERHGPVVLDVARSVLRHAQDAEDVFQASFLVLARNANTIRTRTSIGCWLHGVARRIALRALRSRTRRARHEAVPRDAPIPDDELTWSEVRALIHAELAGLPEALRAPILLCHLEGLTLDEAATRLKLPRGTLRDRLDRGRERLRQRLARRGLAAAAIAFSASSSNATPPLMVLVTARSAVRFAAGFAEPSRAVELANGAVAAMTPTRLKFGLLFAVTFGAVGLVVAGIRDVEAPAVEPPVAEAAPVIDEPEAAAREVVRADLPVAPPPAPAPRVEFESITVVIKPPGLSNEPGGTVRISSDGSCLYEIPGRVLPGSKTPLPGARLVHQLPRDRLRALNQVLKDTDWLKADAKEVPRLHAAEYTITFSHNAGRVPIKRILKITDGSETYPKVLHFFQSIAHQEYLLYRLEWIPETMVEARRALDNIIGGELGESVGKSLYAIDLTRFVPWATRTVRNSFNKQVDEVRVAVRLIGLLKLEAEREHVNDLATDRDSSVRSAVALAVGRLGGEKAVPVLRKMLRSTSEAPWELIKLGALALPTIVDVIQNGGDPSDMGYEHLIRAYIENWKDVPQPLDGRITAAVMAGAVVAKEKAVRTQYHEELLKLIATPPPPEDPKLARARADVLNLANAVEAYRAKMGTYPRTLAALKDGGFVAPGTSLNDPWRGEYLYTANGERAGHTHPDVWAVTPDKVKIGSWAAELWGNWALQTSGDGTYTPRPNSGHWEFEANMVRLHKDEGVFYRAVRYTLDVSREPKQIDLVFGGAVLKGIYEVKGDTLRVAYAQSDKDERPTHFEGGTGAARFLFKRKK